MYLITITERTPTEPQHKDVNTYHLICNDIWGVSAAIENFELNFGVLVSMTITPFKE